MCACVGGMRRAVGHADCMANLIAISGSRGLCVGGLLMSTLSYEAGLCPCPALLGIPALNS